jgi:hypothetical protein
VVGVNASVRFGFRSGTRSGGRLEGEEESAVGQAVRGDPPGRRPRGAVVLMGPRIASGRVAPEHPPNLSAETHDGGGNSLKS